MASSTRLLGGLAVLLLSISSITSGQAGPPSTAKGDWTHYTADIKGSKYSPLDQINASTSASSKSRGGSRPTCLGPRPEYKLEGTPLAINGVLYTTGGTRRSVVALDGATGELIWAHSIREGQRAGVSPRQLSGRGVSYWTDGKGDERILYVTTGYRLVALNAKTGAMINVVRHQRRRRSEGRRREGPRRADQSRETARSACTRRRRSSRTWRSSARRSAKARRSTPTTTPRAWCARSMCAPASCCGRSTPFRGPASSATTRGRTSRGPSNGNVGVWTQITVDEELGLVYLPVETPTSDYYGGHRPGNNLFAESIVCVDLKTGQRKWHFQLVHHPLWNYDMSSAPILADITVNGKPIKARRGRRASRVSLYVFDRVTGQPVWPIEERPVPQSDVPGEKTSPTQPFPTKPPAYARNILTVPDDLIDFTPELRAQALEQIEALQGRRPGCTTRRCSATPTASLGAINMGNADRRHQLAGRRLRSGNAHRLRAGQQRQHHVDVAGGAAEGLLRHSLRVGHRRAASSAKSSARAIAAPPIHRARCADRSAARGGRRRGHQSRRQPPARRWRGRRAAGGAGAAPGSCLAVSPLMACRSSSRRTERSRP